MQRHLLIDGTSLSRRLKGVGRYTFNVCQRLRECLPENYRITLVVFDTELPDEVDRFGMQLHRIPRCRESVLGLWVLPRLICELKPDLLLRPVDASGHQYRVPTITVCHDIDRLIQEAAGCVPGSRAWVHRLRFLAKRRGIRASRKVLAVSDYLRDRLPREYGVDPAICRTTLYGLDFASMPDPDCPDLPHIAKQFGGRGFAFAIATGDMRENYITLPKLFAAARSNGYPGALVVAGLQIEAPSTQCLIDAFAEQSLRQGVDVYLLPFFPSDRYAALLKHFAAADFYVETSAHEGFGMQQLEAMATGTVCLSTGAGALKELGGGFPILYPPEDPAAGGHILAEAWKAGRHGSSPAAQIQYTRTFTWEACTRQLADSILEVATP